MKSYDVVRFKPNALILGTSRADYGLDAQHPAWPSKVSPVYNLALQGAGPYMSYRYLQHVLSQRRLALVVMGLDFEYFVKFGDSDQRNQEPAGHSFMEYESRLATTREGLPNPLQYSQHLEDVLRAFSFSTLEASASTVSGNMASESWDMVSGNLMPDRNGRRMSLQEVTYYNLGSIQALRGTSKTAKLDESAFDRLKSILDLCSSHGVRVILFISPAHVDVLETLDRVGLWPVLEDWKRETTALTAEYSGAHHAAQVSLWDFNGYNSLSMESISLTQHPPDTYFDISHYGRVVGDAIIERIFERGDPNFGIRLSPESIEPHLVTIRNQQRLYREHHWIDAQRVSDLHRAIEESYPNKK